MPGPSMSGGELGGRLIALEATVIALAGELAAMLPPEKAQTALAAIKGIAHEMVDQLAPDFSSLPPIVKDIQKHADEYADRWADMIERARVRVAKTAAGNAGK